MIILDSVMLATKTAPTGRTIRAGSIPKSMYIPFHFVNTKGLGPCCVMLLVPSHFMQHVVHTILLAQQDYQTLLPLLAEDPLVSARDFAPGHQVDCRRNADGTFIVVAHPIILALHPPMIFPVIGPVILFLFNFSCFNLHHQLFIWI